jgi:acyl-CoA thioesterase
MSKESQIIDKMWKTDAFSQWMGVEIIEIKAGYSKLKMTVREDMVNGFDIIHGGITFSFADSALAFAANSHGKMSVALDCTISFPKAVKKGDVLVAESIEFSCSNKVGIYNVTVTNQEEEKVAFFKGTVYRTSKDWEI